MPIMKRQNMAGLITDDDVSTSQAPVYGQCVTHRHDSVELHVRSRKPESTYDDDSPDSDFAALDQSSLKNGKLTVTPLSEHDSSRFDP